MRPYLLASALLLIGTASLAGFVASCGSSEARCTNLTCQAGATVIGHVHAPLATVAGGSFTFCVNDVCGTAVVPPADAGAPDASASNDAGDPPDATLTDASTADASTAAAGDAPTTDGGVASTPEVDFQFSSGVYASGRIIAEPDGWVLVMAEATGTFAGTVTAPGPFQPLVTKDGDRYRLAITGADGSQLLDVTRGVHYDDTYPNGKQCDAVACQVATVNTWPTSPAGVTCSGHPILAEADFTLFATSPVIDNSTLRVCRNDVCDEYPYFLGLVPPEEVAGGSLPGPLLASYKLSNGGLKLQIIVDSDPAAVADGDRYVITLKDHDSGALTVNLDTTATYVSTVPNEPGCDPYPNRTFTFGAQ